MDIHPHLYCRPRYTASALVDQALHQLPPDEIKSLDMDKFEAKELDRLGMPQVRKCGAYGGGVYGVSVVWNNNCGSMGVHHIAL